jgi:hypothetical protein
VTVSSSELTSETKQALEALAALSPDAVENLWKCLADSPVQLFPQSDVFSRVEAVYGADAEETKSIAQLLLYLWWSQSTRKRSREEIAQEVTEAFGKTDKGKDLSQPQIQTLKRYLERLLDNQNLVISQNASSLVLDYERVFAVSRVITDMRPVFEGRNPESMAGGLIVHTLRLSYYKADGTEDEFYVALDDDDVGQLQNALTRAAEKSAQLRALLDRAKVSYIPGGEKARKE